MNRDALNFVASVHCLDMIESSDHSREDKDAMIRDLAASGPAVREETPVHMYLIYPGMTDFEEVEITRETAEPGYCYVRPMGADEIMKVALTRLVDLATARSRRHTQIIERRDDHGGWTVVETSVTA